MSTTVLNEKISRYEDSHQVHSVNVKSWKLVTTMKKLEHNLYIVIDGPDAEKAMNCFKKSLESGAIAAAAAAFIGAGIAAAEIGFAVAKLQLAACLGPEFNISLNDESHWVYWEL